MNYLSHFTIDQKKGDHEFNSGLLLPDLAKKWVRQFHLPSNPGTNIRHDHLLKGCIAHYSADRKFHSSDFFLQLNHSATASLNNIGMSAAVQRKWFIAHVAVELLLDRLIMRVDPTMIDRFYESLLLVDIAELETFLRLNGMMEPQEFLIFFDHFRKVQYIRYYTDNNKLMYSLGKIMLRAGLKEASRDDQGKLLDALLTFEQSLLSDGAAILARLKKIFE